MNVYVNFPKRNPNRNRIRAPIIARVIQMPTGQSLASMTKRTTNSTSAPLVTPTNSTSIMFREKGVGGSVVETASSLKTRTSTTELRPSVIIALTEGRGTGNCEVGVAAIELNTSTLVLSQISDSHSYVNTLTKINIFDPTEILVPNTFVKNRLIEKIREQFGHVKISGLPRSSFNDANGLANIKNFSLVSNNSIVLAVEKRYYALASVSALMSYCESNLNRYFAKQSMWIEYEESEGFAMIDVNTAQVLELVDSAREELQAKCSSLYDILDHCKTAMGRRALRASILQPPCDISEINARLNSVEELITKSQLTLEIRMILIKLAHIDQILTLPTVLPSEDYHCSERHLNYLLLLRTFLEIVEPLSELLENVNSPIVRKLLVVLKKPGFGQLKLLVSEVICEDSQLARGQQAAINQRCYAVKTGINRVLDMLRKCYSQRIDEVIEYVRELGIKHGLSLSLGNNVKKGYHMVLTMNAHQRRTLREVNLPDEFIQVDRLSTTFTMKTVDLIDMTDRVNGIMREILQASNIVIGKLVLKVRDYSGLFYMLCDEIAQLDMMQSLAQASTAMHYVRPQFSEYTELKNARHPLLDFTCPVEPTANSIYASNDYNMHVITGPNGAGKSIFIRQIILIQVMAQVGCYVPAEVATFRVADTILARVYLEDNPACGASAFSLELKEMEYFLNVATPNTILIIDELCRSTSVEEGAALAMALCEQSMQTRAFIFLTTHFKTMREIYGAYFNVSLWQMETIVKDIGATTSLEFTYKLAPGVTAVKDYGIFIAKGILTEEMIRYITQTHRHIEKDKECDSRQIGIAEKALRFKHNFQAELDRLNKKRELTINAFHDNLAKYNSEISSLGFLNDGTSETGPSDISQQLSRNKVHNLQIVQNPPMFNNTRNFFGTNKNPADFFSSATPHFPAPLRDYDIRTIPSKNDSGKTPSFPVPTSTRRLAQVDSNASLSTVASADFSFVLQQDHTRTSTPLPETLNTSQPSGPSKVGFKLQPIITEIVQSFGTSPTGFRPFSAPSEKMDREPSERRTAKTTLLGASAMEATDEYESSETEKSQRNTPSQHENDFAKPCQSGFSFGQFRMPQFRGNFSTMSTRTFVPSQNDEVEEFHDKSAMDTIVEQQLSAVLDQVEESMRQSKDESFTDLPIPRPITDNELISSESSKPHVEYKNKSVTNEISKYPEVKVGPSTGQDVVPVGPTQMSSAASVQVRQINSWDQANRKKISYETSISSRDGSNCEVSGGNGIGSFRILAYQTRSVSASTPENCVPNQPVLKETRSNSQNFAHNQILASRTSSSSVYLHSTPQRSTPDQVVEETSSSNSKMTKAVPNQVLASKSVKSCRQSQEDQFETSCKVAGTYSKELDKQSQGAVLYLEKSCLSKDASLGPDAFAARSDFESKNEHGRQQVLLFLQDEGCLTKDLSDSVRKTIDESATNLVVPQSSKASEETEVQGSDQSDLVSQTIIELIYGHRSTTQPIPGPSSRPQIQFQSERIPNFDIVSSGTDLFGNTTDDSPMAVKNSGPVVQKRPNRQALPRFRPLKYTKKEIKQALFESDQRLLKLGNVDQYIKNVTSRPTVDQIHRAETLAVFYRTPEGFRAVVPPETHQKRKTKAKTKFCEPWSDQHRPMFDVTLFADKNADKFEEYMRQRQNPEPEMVVTTWSDLASGKPGKRISASSGRVSGIKRTKFSTPCRTSDSAGSTSGIFRNEAVQSDVVTPDVPTPDGYYKRNKQHIENIMSKYLPKGRDQESQ